MAPSMRLPDLAEIEAAAAVIRPYVPPTPQYAWPLLALRAGCEVWVKHENHTPIGAFKIRGGIYYLHRLRQQGRDVVGLISATRGNHGQSLAFAGRCFGVPVTIVAPHGNSREKNAAMRAFGAELIEAGKDFDAACCAATELATARRLEMVPPFHPDLVCGVATYALELMRAVPALHTIYCAIGMGSGICGLIRVRDLLQLPIEIVGAVAANAPAYALSLAAGSVVATETADTIADGVACRVPSPEAFAIIRGGVARIVRVGEDEIKAAMRIFHTDTHNLAEGAGAAPLAALLQECAALAGKSVAVILSGGNVDLSRYLQWTGEP